ncbi:hypothetical protein J2S74_002949 [Evansella vedderi]|uniref:Uncharacterized protein n=1 Tax=Evansella vedderi TaxID=38282 RepID=A0ABT9ZXW8_9BACI|nr:hypothetical protein [Evansella vedderi]MDQ0255567.1 hypothetical protein [Evansella vedderi]
MKFKMWKGKEQYKGDPGVWCLFATTTKRTSITFFNNPPESVDHVCKGYLNGRFGNVTREDQVRFIKRRFKEEIVKFQ